MRRALVLAALAAPALALAQVPAAGPGAVIEINNFTTRDPDGATSYVNRAHCAGEDTMNVEWNVSPASGSGGTYQLFATNTEPTNGRCPTELNEQENVFTGSILTGGTVVARGPSERAEVVGSTVAQAARRPCDASGEGQVIWICAHWSESSTAAAFGRFEIQVGFPNPPTGVSAGPGDTRLQVSWTASTGGAVLADRYVARATAVGGTETIESDETTGTSTTISGLQNGTQYEVRVFALSIGGNESEESDPALGTPVPVDDFFDVYRRDPGAREEGGCGTGGAGPLGLVAVGLVALLRRRK
jgi:MYXO-CTERM domain-containing protein